MDIALIAIFAGMGFFSGALYGYKTGIRSEKESAERNAGRYLMQRVKDVQAREKAVRERELER
jgi:hypothetical protein